MSDDHSPIGRTGTVVTATRGEQGPGEVTFSIRGATETYVAISSVPLAVGEQVVCLEDRGGRLVVVDRLDRSWNPLNLPG